MMSKREEGVYVDPHTKDVRCHSQWDDIRKIINKNQMNYFNHLSKLFEKKPLIYFEIEKKMMDKQDIKGISLLVLLKREGKGLASSELFYPPLKNIREIMIKGLMKECRQQAFIQLNEKYQQNGHRIVEITDPYFISSDNKEEKRDLVGIRKHLKKEFAKYPKEEQSVKIEESRDNRF